MDSFGPYAIEHELGAGGMARVYRARSRQHGEICALKVMLESVSSDETAREDFAHEGRLAARIRHPNVVGMREVITVGAQLGLVMDYVEGVTLDRLVKRRAGEPLPFAVATSVLLDVLAGLEAAHALRDESGVSLDVVHRDVSPQNVMIGRDGIAKVADFGIALAASRTTATKTGFVKGKAAYMAPEQARGDALDARVDVWAVGVMAWELFAGRPLFRVHGDVATALRVLEAPIERIETVRPDVPAALASSVHAALQRDLAARAASISTLRAMFVSAVTDPQVSPDRALTADLVHAAMDQDPTLDLATKPLPRVEISDLDPKRLHEEPNARARARPRVPKIALAVVVGATALGALVLARGRSAATAPPSASSSSVITSEPAALSGTSVAAALSMPASASSDARAANDAVILVANAPLRRVKVDGRTYDADGSRVELLVPARADGRTHEVIAFGARGERSAVLRVAAGASAPVRFASRPVPSTIPTLITTGVYE